VHGASWQEAHAYALSLQTEGDAFIHPFDDPLLWQGHATLMTEVAATGLRPAAVVLSVGGGGLLCGVVQGLQTLGWHDVPVLAVETAGAASLNAALLAQERVVLERITSVATSLGARQVCAQAFALAHEHPVHAWWWSPPAAPRWPALPARRWTCRPRRPCWWWCAEVLPPPRPNCWRSKRNCTARPTVDNHRSLKRPDALT
jgi:L-serine/L-threonine ammonia-lyase